MNKSKEEVDKNYKVFKEELPKLIKEYDGKFSLWRHQKFIRCFGTFESAHKHALKEYPDCVFSIQEVTEKPISLGFTSLFL